MKKILLLLIFLLLLCSCSSTKEATSNPSIVVEKITYEQHYYLIFQQLGKYIGIEHDPNCWCMIDYD
mgnify:CR=1 FL=1